MVAAPTPPVAPPTHDFPGTHAPGTANTTVTVDMFDLPSRHFRALSEDDSVGHGHVRDHEQLRRCSAASTSKASGPARSSIDGQSETWTVALAPGFYRFHCDVLPLMKGTLTITA